MLHQRHVRHEILIGTSILNERRSSSNCDRKHGPSQHCAVHGWIITCQLRAWRPLCSLYVGHRFKIRTLHPALRSKREQRERVCSWQRRSWDPLSGFKRFLCSPWSPQRTATGMAREKISMTREEEWFRARYVTRWRQGIYLVPPYSRKNILLLQCWFVGKIRHLLHVKSFSWRLPAIEFLNRDTGILVRLWQS